MGWGHSVAIFSKLRHLSDAKTRFLKNLSMTERINSWHNSRYNVRRLYLYVKYADILACPHQAFR